MLALAVEKYNQIISSSLRPMVLRGKVTQIIGLMIEACGPVAEMGDLCLIKPRQRKGYIPVEVVGFRQDRLLLMPIGDMSGIGPGCDVVSTGKPLTVKVGQELLGRVIDGLGNPLDGKGEIEAIEEYSLHAIPPSPLTRNRIDSRLGVGVKAIDGLLTMGKGQRVGIMAGSGVGKSTLLGMIARNTEAQINVIGLIGERGREVREFIERDLGEEGLRRSVVVVATSDQPALARIKGAYTATAIAEYYRDQGMDVMLMMDSVTRFAMAQREVGLTVGEPPATRGYTPSVFAALPKLLERSGAADRGTITAIYTVLVDGDDFNEPITDAVRGILDGHIVLDRKIAAQNHYPAIDILNSVSRIMIEIVNRDQWQANQQLRALLAAYRDAEDLINIGAYVPGSNATIDKSIQMINDIREFLQQQIYESFNFEQTVGRMLELVAK